MSTIFVYRTTFQTFTTITDCKNAQQTPAAHPSSRLEFSALNLVAADDKVGLCKSEHDRPSGERRVRCAEQSDANLSRRDRTEGMQRKVQQYAAAFVQQSERIPEGRKDAFQSD